MIKRLLIVTTLLFLNSLSVFSYIHLEVPIVAKDELDGIDTIIFGVDKAATIGWDSVLGEVNAPRFKPPPGVFLAAYEIFDSIRLQELVLTYKDFRPIVDSFHFYVQYSFRVVRGFGDLLIFKWNTISPLYIDSVRITDREEDLDLVDVNLMGTKRSDTVKNRYINDYYVKVWYRNPDASIVYEEDNNNTVFSVYPIPADGDKIFIKARSPGFSYKIFTETGIELIAGESDTDLTEFKIADLTKGIYFIVLNTGSGKFCKKLVKL